jgi:hypothetical protein
LEERKLPKLFNIGRYLIFFWSNENDEPIHVHVAITPFENATKVWLTKNGGCIVAHNKGKIPQHDLNELLDIISTRFFFICSEWKKHFNVDDVKFYC